MHERIGIMGGTFDPVHNGHLVIARSVADQLGLDRVLFIPAGNPNFKQDQKLASAADRVRMVELAIAEPSPDFELDLREVERPGVTYTADTLEELARCHEDARLFFIMGTDSAITLPGWKRAEDIARLCTVVVAIAPGSRRNECAMPWRQIRLPSMSCTSTCRRSTFPRHRCASVLRWGRA